MYCTNCGTRLEEKWVYCANCGTKRAAIGQVQKKKGTMTFEEFVTQFSKENNISEEETRELVAKVLTR